MADHLEKRYNTYFASLKVPEDLQAKLGKKVLRKTLGTTDRRKALALARPIVSFWQAEFKALRGNAPAAASEAMLWRQVLTRAWEKNPEEASTLEDAVTTRAEAIELKEGTAAALSFAKLALGDHTPSDAHFEEWAVSIQHLEQKTQDQSAKDVRLLLGRFQALELITASAVRKWCLEMTNRPESPVSASSLKRMVSFWRSYWKFLTKQEAVQAGLDPFALIEYPAKSRKEAATSGWFPFQPDAVVKLIRAAEAKEDRELADLITLGAYTGARIEELCSLKIESIGDRSFKIEDAKTAAGVREVPIHAALLPLLERLKSSSRDGFLLSGLTLNKYGDRSNAIGKRFGRLKAGMGFGDQHVFHSLRKTLVTLLEDAGVSENLAADLVGHEKPRITYGLYSGGASLATKAEALARVSYPGL